MEAVEIVPLQSQSNSIPMEAARRCALFAALLALCVGIGLGSTPLMSTAVATAHEALDRFTGANRIARPDLPDGEIGAAPSRPISKEWRWSPPRAELDGMFRNAS
jgi:hypothetical protein